MKKVCKKVQNFSGRKYECPRSDLIRHIADLIRHKSDLIRHKSFNNQDWITHKSYFMSFRVFNDYFSV